MAHVVSPIFISYSREDVAVARELRDWLIAHGVRPWMDLFDIPAGARWPDEIDTALRASAAVIGLMSPASFASENVKNEWDWAIANGRRLILLLITPCEVPFHYVSRNYIDFTQNQAMGYSAVAAALEHEPRSDKTPGDPEPTPISSEVPPQPSHAFSAPGTSSRLQRAMSRQRSAPVLVGREREQAQLQQQLDAAIGGTGSLLLVGGEAGIGKTTLTRWLQAQAEEQGALILSGGCYDLITTPPYGPWTEILRDYQQEGSLPSMPAQIRDDVGLASIPSQEVLFEIVGEFFAEVSEHRPLVLALEDLHWADVATLEFLRFFARYLSGLPILVVATYRDDEITRRHQLSELMPILIREAPVRRVSLHRLDDTAIHTLVNDRYALSESEVDRLVAYLKRLAEGNPFFTEELLRSLQEDGLLRQSNTTWLLEDLKAADVPPVVRQVVERRLAKLDGSTRELLAVAAVIGHDVPYELWQAVSRADEPGMVETVGQAIDALLIQETADGRGVSFSHALVREALYSGLVALRRQTWHRATAEQLISAARSDPDIIAYHLEQGNDPRLADWLITAGERAQRRHAWIMAAERFNNAQRLLEHDGGRTRERARLLLRIGLLVRYNNQAESLAYLDEAELLATATDDQVAVAEARAHRGLVLAYKGRIHEALDEMKAGLTALERLRASDTHGEDLHHDPHWQPVLGVQGWSTLSLWLTFAGRFEDAIAILDAGERTATAEKTTPDHHRARAMVQYTNGAFLEARAAVQRSAEANVAIGDLWQAGIDVNLEALLLLRFATEQVDLLRQVTAAAHDIWSSAAGGSIDAWSPSIAYLPQWYVSGTWQPIREIAEHIFDTDLLQNVRVLSLLIEVTGDVLRFQGNSELARTLVGRLFPGGPALEPGHQRYHSSVAALLLGAEIALDASDLSEARAWLEALDSWLDWGSARLWRAESSLGWARYHYLDGNRAGARQHANQALVDASEPRQPLMLIASNRFLGMLDTEDQQYQSANQHLEAALNLADACEAPFERALTLIEIARLRHAAGNTEDAHSLLAEVRTICEPLAASPTLDRVDQLAAELGMS